MNQRQRIVKAINLIRPVHASVVARRPAGTTTTQADRIAVSLTICLTELDRALGIYPEPNQEDK